MVDSCNPYFVMIKTHSVCFLPHDMIVLCKQHSHLDHLSYVRSQVVLFIINPLGLQRGPPMSPKTLYNMSKTDETRTPLTLHNIMDLADRFYLQSTRDFPEP